MNTSIAVNNTRLEVPSQAILLWVDKADQPYVAKLGPMFGGAKVAPYTEPLDSLDILVAKLKQKGFGYVVTTRVDVLQRLLPPGRVKKASLDKYTGSIIPYRGIEFLIMPPLKQLVTVEYADWMFRQLLRKVTHASEWRQPSEFRWWLIKPGREFLEAKAILAQCDIIAVDTETVKEPRPAIELVQYTGVHFGSNQSWTYVVEMTSMESVHFMREINALPIPKVLQNGKYDCAYFFAYSAPLTAYYYDLKNAMHCQYAELPKDLAFSSALWLRDIMYWKDLSSTGDKQDKFRYGAMDTWATAEAFISWMLQAQDWAKNNYVTQFQTVPALHMCEMRGLKRDMATLRRANAIENKKIEESLRLAQAYVGTDKFNPRSSQQCVKLICILSGKPIPKTDVKVKDMTPEEKRNRQASDTKAIAKASFEHPLNERILTPILEYRKRTKSVSNYLSVDDKAKEFGPSGKERILYSISNDATDTGRCASKAHHFWCGFNVQNVKGDGRDGEFVLESVKETIIADEGFHLAEADYEQAEDRGVAMKSGDKTLLDIFATGKDSHSYKAAMFFGIPYEEIYDEVTGTKLKKDIRELGKRINHGANYNMGAFVLLETMGPKNVREAQRLLRLPTKMSLLQVCQYLLGCYETAFPTVKKDYYRWIVLQIKQSKKLVGDTGWVRYCFGNPEASKPALNKYIAHVTQSLNAMILNKAFLAVFRELGFNPNFKLLAQIHDSILFQYRIGHEYLIDRVKELMTFPVPVTDCAGITRDLIVPVDVKCLGRTWAGTNE
jgi:DNA polymerase I-like protein with 3'-5' exonuclease and polymerase domains